MSPSQLTPISDIPRSCPGPAACLRQLQHGPPGRAGARAAWGRHSPPKRPAPAPQEQAQQDAVRGSLEAFREERSPGTGPAGKEVSWVCHSVCRSPDSRPRRLSTNGVCVGADGRRASWRQEPKGEGQAAGEWQQVGRSAGGHSDCTPQAGGTHLPVGNPRKGLLEHSALPSPGRKCPLSPWPVLHHWPGERGQALFRLCMCPPRGRSQAQPVGHWGVGNSDMVSRGHNLESL